MIRYRRLSGFREVGHNGSPFFLRFGVEPDVPQKLRKTSAGVERVVISLTARGRVL
jgi:hypothetical protein